MQSPSAIAPTLGIKPEWVWIEERMWELVNAITRRAEAGQPIPYEWIAEFTFHLSNSFQVKQPTKSEVTP